MVVRTHSTRRMNFVIMLGIPQDFLTVNIGCFVEPTSRYSGSNELRNSQRAECRYRQLPME